MALLSHYYQPASDEVIDQLAMTDWITALGDLPKQAVADACEEWVRNSPRRPTPAHIRQRALDRIEKPNAPKRDERPFGPVADTPFELEIRRQVSEELGRLYAMPWARSRRTTKMET